MSSRRGHASAHELEGERVAQVACVGRCRHTRGEVVTPAHLQPRLVQRTGMLGRNEDTEVLVRRVGGHFTGSKDSHYQITQE